ncbi:glycosyltransferase family 2 protein [Escherichia marmotae]|uniref:Glycosyltransferase family 2 protein n=1 Tax=Escherichia marmotae TaxID=1499973 RepID=A0AAW5MLB3_9ESCH|nr:glycosyltransferase family 2 protein [Escherichia marmotae]MEC9640048.1 glycosyltransferase family 2 protein [Escherichia marmotae]MEC9838728.1 glycosyltransferase family 2 protein [Escherichia marmotae]MED9244511.1 glycosyltransferase family 2 protein [Escherichia marmotae]
MKNECLTVILNWNGSEDTISCINSILSHPEICTDIVIIDNDSCQVQYDKLHTELQGYEHSDFIELSGFENGVEVVAVNSYIKNLSQIYLVKAKTNYGFSKGCNAGAFFAEQLNYEYVLFLNNDTEVEHNFLSLLIDGIKKDNITAVIPQIRYFYDKNKIWNCGGSISIYGSRSYYYSNQDYRCIDKLERYIPVSFATGCCILFRTREFLELGMFTEKFFFGEEDIELSLRLLKMNKIILCDTESIIYHKVGASITGDKQKLLRKAYIHYLNRLVNMKTFLEWKWFLWLIPSVTKIIINLIKINKVNLRELCKFTCSIVIDAYKRKDVDKEKFERTLKDGY